MDLVEIKAEIPVAAVEAVDEGLLELGVEEWSLVEDVLAKRAWVVGIFPSRDEAMARWDELRPQLAGKEIAAPVVRVLAEGEWRDSYKAHFKAWSFGRLHWVPIWQREGYVLPPGEEVLWLDPGLAFGTGNHETTRLCVERLVEIEATNRGDVARQSVIDAGCGSGILALSAAKLGFGRIEGFDNDPEAVRVSRENAVMNGIAGRVAFSEGDLISGLRGRTADVVMANILADVLIRFARQLTQSVRPGGRLILSGILATENVAVRTAFAAAAPGWAGDFRVLGEWSDVQLVRPS